VKKKLPIVNQPQHILHTIIYYHYSSVMQSITLLLLIMCSVPCSGAADSWPSKVVKIAGGGGYYFLDPPGPLQDPIPTPSIDSLGIERERLPRKGDELITAALVDRSESHYADSVCSDVVSWLQERPEIRSAFWLALADCLQRA
jgi:hypothetical protein